jgi:hypothetical protein
MPMRRLGDYETLRAILAKAHGPGLRAPYLHEVRERV